MSEFDTEQAILKNPVRRAEQAGVHARTVENGLSTLPDRITRELEDHGIKVYVFKNISEYDKAFGTHKASEHGASDAPSLFDKSAKPPRVAVFENLPDGRPVKDIPDTNPAGYGRHEVGHAHSFLNGDLADNDAGFKRTLENELKAMPAQKLAMLEADLRGGPLAHYYGSAQELYAEMFAMVTGGASDLIADQRFRYYFPQTVKYMAQEYKK